MAQDVSDLAFARRAFELARWYRERGAKVILGGLHVLSCPDECAPHADALALGDGVQLWPRILRDVEAARLQSRYIATYENAYAEDPSPRRSLLPRRSFLTSTSVIATRCPSSSDHIARRRTVASKDARAARSGSDGSAIDRAPSKDTSCGRCDRRR